MTTQDNHNERSIRLKKLENLRSLGVKIYPDKFSDKQDISDIRKMSESLKMREIEEIIQKSESKISTA